MPLSSTTGDDTEGENDTSAVETELSEDPGSLEEGKVQQSTSTTSSSNPASAETPTILTIPPRPTKHPTASNDEGPPPPRQEWKIRF